MNKCGNAYCEENGKHKFSDGFYYCDVCIHEFVYDECDPDPCKARAEYLSGKMSMIDKMETQMTEFFLINYSPMNETVWDCYSVVQCLAVATDISFELRTKGFRTNVQSILIDEDGRVKL